MFCQSNFSLLLSNTDRNGGGIGSFWPCRPNTDDYFESLPYPPAATVGLTGLAQSGKAIPASDIGLDRNGEFKSFELHTTVYDRKSTTSDKSCSFSVQCFLDASPRWKNTRLPSGHIQVSGRIAGYSGGNSTTGPGHFKLAILFDNAAFVGETVRSTSGSLATTGGPSSNPTAPKKRGREAWAKKATPQKGPIESLRTAMLGTGCKSMEFYHRLMISYRLLQYSICFSCRIVDARKAREGWTTEL